MTNTIIVYPEAFKFYLASEEGWIAQVGHKVHINGYDFSFTAQKFNGGMGLEMLVSECQTGCRFISFTLSFVENEASATKEGTLKIIAEKAGIVAEMINALGKEKMDAAIEASRVLNGERLCEKPEAEVYEE